MHEFIEMIGRQLGPYRVLDRLGEGGMGEVYAAEDARLKRRVAIKVLPAAVANDQARLARFEQEALATAALNHPNILVVHDIGNDDGRAYVVAELLEGKTLRDVLNEGTPAVAKAIEYATQIAQGLAAAHARGIVHRDLKPENLFVTADGRVKILDFGLAKVVADGSAGSGAATETGVAFDTEPGTVVGTAGYMAPEQVRGETVDARTDLFSLGVVLYELLTGRRAFARDSAADSITAILRDEPEDVSALRPVSPALARLVARCLEKTPASRFQSASDLAFALQTLGTATSSGSVDTQRTVARSKPSWFRDPRSIVALGLGAASLAIAAFAWMRTGDGEGAFPFRLEMSGVDAQYGAATLSPDGRSIVFVRSALGSPSPLYLRRLDQTAARVIPGTDISADPVFSPDGRSIAYVANRHTLMKTTLDGSASALAEIGDMGGGLDWFGDEIVAGSGVLQGLTGLLRVSAAGGTLREFTHVDRSNQELSHQRPRVLADGKTVLFTIWHGAASQSELGAVSLDGDGKVTRLGIQALAALGVANGQLVYARSDGELMAVPFDVTTRTTRGSAMPVQERVSTGGGNTTGRALAFLSHGGGLIFHTGEPRGRLVWADRNGTITPAFKDARAFDYVRLSPDGRQAAVVINTANNTDVWVLDFAAGTLTRLTTTGQTRNVSWSADGRRVLFTSTHGGRAEFWWQPTDGGPPVKAATPPVNPWWADLSPDRHSIVYNGVYDGSWNVQSLSLDTPNDARQIAAAPTGVVNMPRFSPDGAFVAYVSNETGREDVYVRPFSQPGGRVQISVNGGRRPIWSADGREIFFRDGDQVMSATLARDPSIRVTSRRRLFSGDFERDFDVAKDGRFLLIQRDPVGPSLVIVPDWLTQLRRLTRTK